MTERHDPDPAEQPERREAGRPLATSDPIAMAAEFGDAAVDALCTVLACYEAMRTTDDLAR